MGQGLVRNQLSARDGADLRNPWGTAVFGGNTTPIPLSATDRTRANTVYDRWAQSVDAFEQSAQVSSFSSKFDAFLAGKYKLTPEEMAGFKLFDGKANCNSCHLDGRGTLSSQIRLTLARPPW